MNNRSKDTGDEAPMLSLPAGIQYVATTKNMPKNNKSLKGCNFAVMYDKTFVEDTGNEINNHNIYECSLVFCVSLYAI